VTLVFLFTVIFSSLFPTSLSTPTFHFPIFFSSSTFIEFILQVPSVNVIFFKPRGFQFSRMRPLLPSFLNFPREVGKFFFLELQIFILRKLEFENLRHERKDVCSIV